MAKLKKIDASQSLFNEEVTAETSASLGRAGRMVETALQALRAHPETGAEREKLLKKAVEAVYWYFVQREVLGFTNQDEASSLYEIPDEVLVRLGCL